MAFVWRNTKDFILISGGIFSATIGLKGFLLPNEFLDGGVTGIALLSGLLSGIDISYLIVAINIPFIFLAWRELSLKFAAKTSLAVIGLALIVKFAEFPVITNDKLLIAVFGGIFLGGGIGLAIRGGAVLDGTEVFAIFVSERTSRSVGDVITGFNLVLFGASAALIGIDRALYSILTYVSASKMVDFLVHGADEFVGITIVSDRAAEIQELLTERFGCGVTTYAGTGGYIQNGNTPDSKKILFSVLSRLEVNNVVSEIEKIDPKVFLVQQMVNDSKGGLIRKKMKT